MKRMIIIMLVAFCLLLFSSAVSAESDLPIDGSSWVDVPISDVAKVLQEAGYNKSEVADTDDSSYVGFYHDEKGIMVYLFYNKQTLKAESVSLIYYSGVDRAESIVESYSLIYGDPVVSNSEGNEVYIWGNAGYLYTVNFATSYENTKKKGDPFVLNIEAYSESSNVLDGNNEEQLSEPEATPAEDLEIGHVIDLPFVKMSFSKIEKLDKLTFTEKETGSLSTSLHKTMDNAKYIVIRGTIMNMSKHEMDVRNGLRGFAYVDGYEYQLGFFSSSDLNPLTECSFYLYALVPNELVNSFEKCEFRFGFNDEFQTDYLAYDESIFYDHKYQIIVK